MGQGTAAIREEIAQTRERMGDTIDAISYKADVPARAKESVAGTVQGVRERITGTGQDLKERLTGTGEDVRDRVQGAGHQLADATPDGEDVKRAGRRAVGMAQSNPFGLVVGAAAIGFLAGLAAPSTPIEDEHLGPAADQVRQQATQISHDAAEHTRQLVSETAEVAREKAAEVAHEVTEKASEVASDVSETASAAAGEVGQRAEQHADSLRDDTRQRVERA